MNIHSMGQNNFFNASRINQSVSNRIENNHSISGRQSNRKDSVSITPIGKAMSAIEMLMKQKDQINEHKHKLIGNALKNGDDIGSIKSQLESYEMQLESVDEQISNIMTQEMEDRNEKPTINLNSQPSTQEDIENQKISNLIGISLDVKQVELIEGVKLQLESQLTSLSNSDVSSKSSLQRASDISQRLKNITSEILEKLSSANENIKENNNQEQVSIAEDIEENNNQEQVGIAEDIEENNNQEQVSIAEGIEENILKNGIDDNKEIGNFRSQDISF